MSSGEHPQASHSSGTDQERQATSCEPTSSFIALKPQGGGGSTPERRKQFASLQSSRLVKP